MGGRRRPRGWEPGPEHRSIVVIDIAGFGRRDNRAQLQARAALHTATRAAFGAAGVAWPRLAVEDRGDGMIVLVPASVSKADLLDPVVPSLAAALARENAAPGRAGRIRVRVSVHAGEVHRDARGWVGTDLNLACRLIDSEPVYRLLDQAPHADLALVVSDLIHHSVVQHGYRRIDPADYSPAHVVVKEVAARAWVHIPAGLTQGARSAW
jgi:hypothetical protein